MAFIKKGAYLYLFGIPGGRYGGVKLARVAQERMLEPGAYRYYNGHGALGGEGKRSQAHRPSAGG